MIKKFLIGILVGVLLTSVIAWGIIDIRETTRKAELFVTASEQFCKGFYLGEKYGKLNN